MLCQPKTIFDVFGFLFVGTGASVGGEGGEELLAEG